jgi:hypothetical protein
MRFLRPALLLALTALGTISCGFVYDFDGYGVKSEGSGCDEIDVSSDDQNCGACGIDCAGGKCLEGICSPVAFPLGQTAAMVASLDDVVFVVRGEGATATLLTLPVDYDSQTQPGLNENVCDTAGFLSVEGVKAYYRPQDPTKCPEQTFVFSCDAASPCAKTTYALMGQHINGVAVVGSSFFFIVGTQILIAPLSADGIPSTETNVWVAGMMSPGSAGAAYHMDYDIQGDALWWTTFSDNGCIYRKPSQSAPEGTVGCFSQSVTSPGTFLVSPSGDMYVESLVMMSLPNQIFKFNPETPAELGPPFFASTEVKLLAADKDYVYTYDGDPKSLVLLRHASGEERARVFVSSALGGVDARHPDYVFFTSGGALYRLRKPPASQ